jgi:hypothetical protein
MTALVHDTDGPGAVGTLTFGIEGQTPAAFSVDQTGSLYLNGVLVAGAGADPVLLAPVAPDGNVATAPAAGQDPWLTLQQPYSAGDTNSDAMIFYGTSATAVRFKGTWVNGNSELRSAASTATRRGTVAYELAEAAGGPSTSVYVAWSTNPTDPGSRENLLGGYGTGHSTMPGWVVSTRVILGQLGVGFGGTFGTLSQGIWRGRSTSLIGAPTSGTYSTGDTIVDSLGAVCVCTAGGTPGTWAVGGQEAFSDPGIVFAAHVSTGAVPLQVARTSRGMLVLSGGISADTTGVAAGGTLFTLPVGYRPSALREVTARTKGGAASAMNFDFNTDGTVVASANMSGASPTTVSFDGFAIRLV